MIQVRVSRRQPGTVRVRFNRHPAGRPVPAFLAVSALQLLLLASAAACSTPSPAGGGNPALAASAGVQATPDPATLDAKARLEAALTRPGAVGTAVGTAPGTTPGTGPRTEPRLELKGAEMTTTEQIRAAVAAAGFSPDEVEITADRTPTGLAADAVEVAAHAGRSCVVVQLRDGFVVSRVLPALAGGGCLVGAVVTR